MTWPQVDSCIRLCSFPSPTLLSAGHFTVAIYGASSYLPPIWSSPGERTSSATVTQQGLGVLSLKTRSSGPLWFCGFLICKAGITWCLPHRVFVRNKGVSICAGLAGSKCLMNISYYSHCCHCCHTASQDWGKD